MEEQEGGRPLRTGRVHTRAPPDRAAPFLLVAPVFLFSTETDPTRPDLTPPGAAYVSSGRHTATAVDTSRPSALSTIDTCTTGRIGSPGNTSGTASAGPVFTALR
jgi:hypothetical protein